ncbi:phosphomevalonate kinase [Virgibacillus necropolis]|uniref:phosphomevalonate kinase n=1 Tax=Virgibacillus necropolis TaxID=163877 RepID=A0A221M7M8_9BACI|nr:phosphomevalonate kinase [Virgibacillus necropolis]ASN03634.1 phosphomevalonate kinase [Virgibacillus necropolis]
MTNEKLTIKVPGKLMIAGEFALLEANQRSIVMAVDRFVYATIKDCIENRVSLPKLNLENLKWEIKNNNIHIVTSDRRVNFVENAMNVAYRYVTEQGKSFANFDLAITSELDDDSGIKYGLGSSAAVVTAVIRAVLEKQSMSCSPKLLFKLAAIAHVETQGSGSGADVAASSFGGLVTYTSFQAEWLKDAFGKASSITELVERDWPYFSVKPIELPADIHMLIGWTGSPASTKQFLKKIALVKVRDAGIYNQFIDESALAVSSIIRGVESGDNKQILNGIASNRKTLANLGKHAEADIETALLKILSDIAEKHGGAGKPSGAGGGDCGIVFLPSKEKAERVIQEWEEAGIKQLSLSLNLHGAKLN